MEENKGKELITSDDISSLKKIWDKVKKKPIYIYLFLSGSAGTGGMFGFDYAKEKINTYIDNRVDIKIQEALDNSVIIDYVLGSESVTEAIDKKGNEVALSIKNEINKKDSSEVNLIEFIGKVSGLRNENVMNVVAYAIKAYNDGELMTKAQMEEEVKKAVRRASIRYVEPAEF